MYLHGGGFVLPQKLLRSQRCAKSILMASSITFSERRRLLLSSTINFRPLRIAHRPSITTSVAKFGAPPTCAESPFPRIAFDSVRFCRGGPPCDDRDIWAPPRPTRPHPLPLDAFKLGFANFNQGPPRPSTIDSIGDRPDQAPGAFATG